MISNKLLKFASVCKLWKMSHFFLEEVKTMHMSRVILVGNYL